MKRPDIRRRRAESPAVVPLEARHLLSLASPLPPGKAAEIASQAFRDARPAPQSPSPVTTRVSVATDRPSYAPGDPVRITLTQAVIGPAPVNTGPMGNYDVIVTQRGRELWRWSETRGPKVASHVLITMQPGESRQVEVSWDGRARDGSIVTGPVEIRAEVDRVSAPPRTVSIGVARPAARPAPIPSRPPSSRPTPEPISRPHRDPSADLARARQLQQEQLRRAAEARRASLDRPSRPPLPGSPPPRRFP